MPRITKWSEKCQLVKPKYDDWSMDLERKYISPPAQSTEKPCFDARYPTEKLLKIIEGVIDRTLPQAMNEYFDKFVDVKEVPYGRHNSDTDHQGS